MTDFMFAEGILPDEGSMQASERHAAAQEFARRCFNEAFDATTVAELPEAQRPKAEELLRTAHDRALADMSQTDKIINEHDRMFDEEFNMEDEYGDGN